MPLQKQVSDALSYKARKDLVFWIKIAAELAESGERDFKSLEVVLQHAVDSLELCKHRFANSYPSSMSVQELQERCGDVPEDTPVKPSRPRHPPPVPPKTTGTSYSVPEDLEEDDFLSVREKSLAKRPEARKLFESTVCEILTKLGPKKA